MLQQIIFKLACVTAQKPSRSRYDIYKQMSEEFISRHRKPFNVAWMDYCDPYHCKDYHKKACGLNRKTMRFKWFDSVCHLLINNQCATYRGFLKYDVVDPKFCRVYVMYLRDGSEPCESCNDDDSLPVCAVNANTTDVAIFKSLCAMGSKNCELARPEFKEVSMILCIIQPSATYKYTESTLGVHDRVVVLKNQLRQQFKKAKLPAFDRDIPVVDEYKDYEEIDNPIIPIKSKDPRKKVNLYALKTTAGTILDERDLYRQRKEDFARNPNPKPSREVKPQKSKVIDLFYRRVYDVNIVNQFLMCTDLLTPYLTGSKTNMSVAKVVNYTDPLVLRLIQLLTEDLSDFTAEDIRAVLYQISNIQIRLYQWDVSSLRLLISVVINHCKCTDALPGQDSPKQSFKLIKMGIKALFNSWKLTYENDILGLRKQTNIYRPPCMKITDSTGSTKSSKGVRYSKSVLTKKVCIPKDPKSHHNPLSGDGDCVGTWIAKK